MPILGIGKKQQEAPPLTPSHPEPGVATPLSKTGEQLGKKLLNDGVISQQVLDQAMKLQSQIGRGLGQTLLDMGILSEEQLYHAYAELTGYPVWDGEGEPFDEESLPKDFLSYNKVLPVRTAERDFFVVANVEDPGLTTMLRKLYPGAEIRLAAESEIQYKLESSFDIRDREIDRGDIGDISDIEHLKDLALEAPIIRLVNDIVLNGIKLGASDIHLEPLQNNVELRYRVDGVLINRNAPTLQEYPAVVSRIKILSNLDIAERRLPQDGKFSMKTAGREVDVRVSTVPTSYGEDLSLRILDQKKETISFESTGLSKHVTESFNECLKKSHGLVLVTGPTGSGKTTTLYSALQEVVDGKKKIITVEDPIEYQIPGITQIQVNPDIGMTFASSLRSILRHDPDVILIGEIRDRETAEIAVQASLTGHLVLSTVHTNTAVGAVTRLLNMGVPDYLLASSLIAVSAQRLIRKLCPDCRKDVQIDAAYAKRFGVPEDTRIFEPVGCTKCSQTGYLGRFPIAEFMQVDDKVRNMIMQDPTEEQLLAASTDQNFKPILEDGFIKVRTGMTTLEEIFRVAG